VVRRLPAGEHEDVEVEIWSTDLASPQPLSSTTVTSLHARVVFVPDGGRPCSAAARCRSGILTSCCARFVYHRPDRGWFLLREDSEVGVEAPRARLASLALATVLRAGGARRTIKLTLLR